MAELFKDIGVRRKVDNQLVNGCEALKGKTVVALYFSAHWCPPCRNFTPVLKQFYDQVKAMGEPFEIVFVPFDRSEEDVNSYLEESHGDWLYVPYGSDGIQTLATNFGISGIPALVVVNTEGTVLTKDGRSDVQGKPAQTVIGTWETMAKKK